MDISVLCFLTFLLGLIGFFFTGIGFTDNIKPFKFAFTPFVVLLIWVLISMISVKEAELVKEEFTVKTVDNVDVLVDKSLVLNLNGKFNRDFEEGDIIVKEIYPEVRSLGVMYPEEIDYKVKEK